jgi:hypothetical protein
MTKARRGFPLGATKHSAPSMRPRLLAQLNEDCDCLLARAGPPTELGSKSMPFVALSPSGIGLGPLKDRSTERHNRRWVSFRNVMATCELSR